MTSKTKIFGIALVVAVVTALLVYVPLTLAVSRNNQGNEETNPMPMFMNAERPSPMLIGGFRHELLRRFIANSTHEEVHGTVVALVNRTLVLNTAEGQVRILLPPKWTVGDKVSETRDLFETGYLAVGQSIIVETLKGTLVTKETYSIYVFFGYEIINASGVHAYAVLPFNIKTP